MKPKTKKQIADSLGISMSTFRRKLKSSQLDVPRGLIYPKMQKQILEAFEADDLWIKWCEKTRKASR